MNAELVLAVIDRELATVRAIAEAPRAPRLGCVTVAHDRLGYCAACTRRDLELEVNGWRLLALRDAAEAK